MKIWFIYCSNSNRNSTSLCASEGDVFGDDSFECKITGAQSHRFRDDSVLYFPAGLRLYD